MKFIPILFSTQMVNAIIFGRKTQTRRVVKGIPESLSHESVQIMVSGMHSIHGNVKCPYGKPGDILWVRETWAPTMDINGKKPLPDAPIYKTDYLDYMVDWNWKPNIHMPKESCRIFLKVKSIRVELLQDISEEDAEKEGIDIVDYNCYENYMVQKDWHYDEMNQKGFHMIENPIGSFASLWAKINGEESWNENPWVWVVEFERIKLTEDQMKQFLS